MRILSYGAGVNSTAILALIKLGRVEMPDRIIFCDTGAERPETMCYLKYIQDIFPQIETVKNEKYGSLIKYCQQYRIFPCRQFRWCTDKFKIQPFKKATEEHIKILGIDLGEMHRIRDLTCEYPLVDLQIKRRGCIDVIKEAGLEVPVKSGCYICPFMKKTELIELKNKHREQFDILVELERIAHERHDKMYFRGDKLIPEYIGDDEQLDLIDGLENYQHCLCKFD